MQNVDIPPPSSADLPGSPRDPLYIPQPATIAASQMTAFLRFCETETGLQFKDPALFHRFTVDNFRRFWALFLGWSKVACEGSLEPVCVGDDCETATFFPNLRLSYVENLLRIDSTREGDAAALTTHYPSGRSERLTRQVLSDRVASVALALEALGVVPGDRVVAIANNDANAIIAGLGAVAVGASLSTASPEMGAFSIIGRFAHLVPSVLLCHLRGAEGASAPGLSDRVVEVARALPSLRAIIVLDDGVVPSGLGVPSYALSDILSAPGSSVWRRFQFNQPLFILFSSGTTGPPKCIVHGAGGTLLEHVKEHRLHVDLRPADKLFFHTSCAWMMWNWQLSALASGVELVLYPGAASGPDTLWRVVSDEKVTVFGTSPAYLKMSETAGFSPRNELSLGTLRAVLSTGSVLADAQYDWVREHVGELPLQSISGGTDIIGCFVLGNPNLPIYRGEIQGRSLGMDVQAQPRPGANLSSPIGELVCRVPFPSRPLGLYGDAEGTRFHDAYFAQNEGAWTHGDLIELSPEGAARIHGRSDGVLNVRGVRIGPAEIYRILDDFSEILQCLVVEQCLPGIPESRLILLVVLRPGVGLDASLKRRIRRELAHRGSPGHVPEVILAVSELPTTHSGKHSERAARDAVNGKVAVNIAALRNPASVEEIGRRLAQEVGAGKSAPRPASSPSAGSSDVRAVRAAWELAFDRGTLSLNDDFFELGGTSMVALQLLSALREGTGRDLPPSILFEAPTIALMATTLRSWAVEPFTPVVRLAEGGAQPPLFLVHGLAGDVLELRALARSLPGNRPVLGLRAPALDPREQPHGSIEEMAHNYVRQVRQHQPSGPYLLAGYSFGGLVAYEMARRLQAAGEPVAFVGLLADSSRARSTIRSAGRPCSSLASTGCPSDSETSSAIRSRYPRASCRRISQPRASWVGELACSSAGCMTCTSVIALPKIFARTTPWGTHTSEDVERSKHTRIRRRRSLASDGGILATAFAMNGR